MRVIVSLQQDDGTYREVGMNTRTVIGPYAKAGTILKHARAYANGKRARIEWYADSILGQPYRVSAIN